MHIRRNATKRSADGAVIWCYWVSTDGGQVWDVALIEVGTAYRAWVQGDPIPSASQPHALFSDRQEAILAAVAAHERRGTQATAG